MGSIAFKKAQFEIEATSGSKPTNITTFMLGVLTANPEVVFSEPEDDTGLLSRFTRRTLVDESSALSFEAMASYDHLIYPLLMSVKGGVTGSQVNSKNCWSWAFSPNLNAVNNLETLSIEAGDDVQVYDIPFVLCTDFELGFAAGEVSTLRMNMMGRPLTSGGSFDSATSLPSSIVDIAGGDAKLYIDTTWAGLGGSEKSSTLISGTIRVNSGLNVTHYCDGNTYFGGMVEARRNLEIEIVYLHNSNAVAENTAFLAGTKRFIRIEFTGPALDGEVYKLTMDVSGTYSAWGALEERNGETVVSCTLTSEYDATGTKEYEFTVQNSLSVV